MSQHLLRARILLDQSRYDLAERELRQALLADPNDFEPYTLMAICLSHGPREQLKEAEEMARRAISIAPDQSSVHSNLARVLTLAHRLKEARQAADEAVRLDPNDSWNFAVLALIFCQGQRWQEAIEAAEQGLRLNPEDEHCQDFRSTAMTFLGRGNDAAASIEESLRQNPMNPTAHSNRGWMLLRQGKPKDALEHFREALRIDAEHDGARAGLVEALKARNPVYRVLLAYIFWMISLSSSARMGILIGGFIIYRLLDVVSESNPQLAPLIRPVLYAYIAFALLTWLGQPLFDSLLRLNKYGRYALTDRERRASDWFLSIAGASIICWIAYLIWDAAIPLLLGLMLPPLLLPVSVLCQTKDQKFRRQIGIAIAAMSLLILAAVFFAAMNDAKGASQCLRLYGYSFVAASVFISYSSAQRPSM